MVILNYDDSNDSNMGNVDEFTLWHRKSDDRDYPTEPTCRLFKPNTKFLLSGLAPSMQYLLKVVAFFMDRELGSSELQFQTRMSQNEAPKSKILEAERSQSPLTNCSSLSNPSSVEDETNNVMNRREDYLPSSQSEERDDTTTINPPGRNTIDISDQSQKETTLTSDVISSLHEECSKEKTSCPLNKDMLLINRRNKESSNVPRIEEMSTDNGSSMPPQTGLECVPYVNSLPITPCKFENAKDEGGRSSRPKLGEKKVEKRTERGTEPQAGSSSKKRSVERRDVKCSGIGDKDFEYYVKVMRWLEHEGHIDTSFRQSFLTWYTLRATPQEVRVVKVFIDTFVEDPENLAGQLLDSFSDIVSNKRCSRVPTGFCTKLWH